MPGVSFDRAVEYYDATRGYPPGVDQRIRDAVLRTVGADAQSRFVELGVGTGRIALPFISAGFDYTGVDISRQMMGRLRAKVAGETAMRGVPRYRLLVGDVMHVPLRPATFDVAIMVHILHLVADWRAVLGEAVRVLRPGGRMLVGYDDHPGRDDLARQGVARWQVYPRWNAILAELGVHERARPGSWTLSDLAYDFLREQGISVRRERLVEYEQHALSARQVAERLFARMSSGEWDLPDEIHAEAARRLQRWLDEECADPDTPVSATSYFTAIIATVDS